MHINGQRIALVLDPRRTLLDVLRDDLQLTGTKKACDMGSCGACTVLADGRAVYSCLMLAIDWSEAQVLTIEGLSGHGGLDDIQQAFLDADAFQCGFCTPGQIMSMRGLLNESKTPDNKQILRALSGNLCRCGAYQNLLRAGRMAVGRGPESTTQGSALSEE